MAFESDPEDPPELDPEDLPLHPTIRRRLVEYARAADNERDVLVARILTEFNALLHDRDTVRREPPSS